MIFNFLVWLTYVFKLNLEMSFILGYNAHCVNAPKSLLMIIIIKIISILEYN